MDFKWTSEDKREWAKLSFEMPFRKPGGATAIEAFKKPGNCVKSTERDNNRMAVAFGRLLTYDESGDQVIVLGVDSPISPMAVWRGTVQQYFQTWEID